MIDIKKAMLSAILNFRKWRGDWRIIMIAVCAICFCFWNAQGFARFGADYGLEVTAWIFPHLYANPVMLLIYGYFVVTLFSDAPFMDEQTMFWLSRCGRLEWILGQMIYIVIASLIFALFLALTPILALLPNVSFAPEWGDAIMAIADNSEISMEYNISIPALSMMMIKMAPLKAMAISTLMTWLISMFMGGLMLFANLTFGGYTGTVTCSIITFMSYVVSYFDDSVLGISAYYFSPVNWMTVYGMNWLGDMLSPPPAYGISVLLLATLLCFSLSAYIFCKRDVNVRQGGILQ